jgi:DNA invertase Pin-like site-specific DNA recombinase
MRRQSKELQERIKSLYRRGLSATYIANALEINRTTVWRYLKRMKVALQGHSTRSFNYWNGHSEPRGGQGFGRAPYRRGVWVSP